MNAVGMYPRNLTYMVKRLSQYSRNTFKIQSLNSTTAAAGQQVVVDLPSNTLVDLNSFTWFFRYSTATTAGVADLPRNIESIIERLEIECNGQILNSGCNQYNQLWNIIADTTFGEDITKRRAILQKGGDVPAPVTANATNVSACIQNFLGLMSSVSVLNTRIVGNVRLRITLASNAILAKSHDAAGETYGLNDMFFSVDCFDLDPLFHESTEKYLASGGVIEIPFHNYFSFSGAATSLSQTTKFSLSTQSLNKVWATFLLPGQFPVAGGVAGNAIFTNAQTAQSPYFTRPAFGVLRFGQGGTNYTDVTYQLANWQFNINGTMYPNFKPDAAQAYALMLNAYNLSQDTLGGGHPRLDSLARWMGHYWCCCQNFEHLSESGDRWLSGIDTRGNIAQGYWETQGTITPAAATGAGGANPGANIIAQVYCQATSTLRIGAGRQLEVVQ